MKRERELFVDGIRGLAAVNMVIFHFLYDVYMVYGRDPAWYYRPWIHIWQQIICQTFILTAGYVWRFGEKNSLKRGIFFHLCGGMISLVTWKFVPEEAIWFGILSFMGSAVLLMLPLHRFCRRIPAPVGMAVSFVCFILFKQVQSGVISIGEHVLVPLPDILYRVKFLTPFGFPFPGFSSSDYFPILPWFFLFLTGYFLYPFLEEQEFWKCVKRKRVPLFSWIGQKSIWIYLVHQPVCMGLCLLIFHVVLRVN